ncbi:PREDICTED: butyrophilin subfamily 2 member A1 [Elephantulus edwardii]|uniref:butyrophilin subfamily 2 member A1 n=1 Tax=Elephantulus edwardii TaxID=28737 RepID=UPI0003F0E55B|nr:PREDICTED: butyrophilin subfamily 2 member A1 [Elephantulus edwardii]
MDAQNMEVRWYNLHLGLVHHYKSSQDHTEHQSLEYRGRTEFLKENITTGQVALRICHIHSSDEGEYSCFFSSSGTGPYIHIEHNKAGGFKLTCTSTGWYPKPEVLWRDMEGQYLMSASETTVEEQNGLFYVETSIMVDESSKGNVSCFIKNPLFQVVKEAHISLAGALFPKNNPSTVGLAVFLGLLIVSIVIILVVCKIKLKKVRNDRDNIHDNFEKVNKELGLDRVRQYAEDIILDKDTAHPYLHVSDDGKTVTSLQEKRVVSDIPEQFDTMVAVLGQNTFSNGDHYWEVSVQGKNRWTIGLCVASINRKGQDISAHPKNGFWTLCLKNGVYKALSTPHSTLQVPEHISTVGIFLQYEKGLISFYNVTDFTILYIFKIESTEKLKPYFYPGPYSEENSAGLTLLKISPTGSELLSGKD